ncbi:MAG: DUF1844 domain-containing protein [Endomicrobium sp.]|jgi:hypothetical protein|uniref:DUF1844 domain-containing protein n=1 Tax=Candidatus Endomicrobiellum cubanum TaxID=3242325 RepID=UPI002824257D|nr:DUF1844 domain-containing protein [Endomicrobium sp.]
MLEQNNQEVNPHFFNVVTMFASSAWCQLGKIQNPTNGKVEKDLKGAQFTIDMLLMLRDKTRNNLTKKEEEMLVSMISNLQMNYADEISKVDSKIDTNSLEKPN